MRFMNFKNKKILFSLLASLLLAASCANDSEPVNKENLEIKSDILETKQEQLKTVNMVSLEFLMSKTFDGRDLTLGEVLSDNQYYTRYYITYKSGELTISGIMNVPKGTPPKGGWPILFLNHGHIDTKIYTNGRGLKREQDYLAKQGFAVLHSDYRNHAQSDKDPNEEYNFRLGYTEDVINAVLAVKNSTLENINKEKIGMLGHSMGGGITQNILVTKPGLIKAAVLYAPVSGKAADSFERWTVKRPEIAQTIKEKYEAPEENPEFWEKISAETYFKNITEPMLYFHGTSDKDVPIEWSQKTVSLLESLKKNVKLVKYQNQPHEFTPPTWNDFMEKTANFFKNNLN